MLNNILIANMHDCSVSFSGPVSRSTICAVVVDCLKHILFCRGQFPLPLDQLKNLVKAHEKRTAIEKRILTIDNFPVYYDEPDDGERECQAIALKPTSGEERTKQKFIETIIKFDEFFNQLTNILNNEKVSEIVLNLGSNMMNPKELYRIMMPPECVNSHCSSDYLSFQRCRRQFYHAVMKSNLWEDLNSDSPVPISVLLLLEPGDSLNEYMEQKRFYALPKCKHRTVRFCNSCVHGGKVLNIKENLHEQSTSSSSASSSRSPNASKLWVKVRPDLRGFKEQPLFDGMY
ncbi:MAD2L1-binding protein-like [Stegodyphus dumicola]|uniref:MAD2L1-binding protein-like n=1 Tax=Stegodyphus dumicola TaxID=202533 RepID=UPI0015B31FD4|nr:MAD2L1-binding protein-like [Stegodyphus dumicola]